MSLLYASAIEKLRVQAHLDSALALALRANWSTTVARLSWLSSEEKQALIRLGSGADGFQTQDLIVNSGLDVGSGSLRNAQFASPSVDPRVVWSQADQHALLMNNWPPASPEQWAWNAGRTRDVLVTQNNSIIVAAETGGVWLTNFSGQARPLSHQWAYPDTNALAQGRVDTSNHASRDHVLAGGGRTLPTGQRVASLYETDVTTSSPLDHWLLADTSDPTGALLGEVFRIVTVDDLVFLASDSGVYWSWASPPGLARYSWQPAILYDSQLPLGVSCTGLAVARAAPGTYTVIAGARSYSDGKSPVLLHGTWAGSILVLFGASVPDEDGVQLDAFGSNPTILAQPPVGPAFIDICTSTPAPVAYAAVARNDGALRGIWRSIDRGATWSLVSPYVYNTMASAPLWSASGVPQSGQYNGTYPGQFPGCLAVSPDDPNLVACGWVTGPFVSADGGQSWRQCGPSGVRADDPNADNRHVHADLRSLRFAPQGTLYRGLFVCSDGGLAYTYAPGETLCLTADGSGATQFGICWTSQLNRQLLTLQCGSAALSYAWGTLSASVDVPGLVTVGLQDNGTGYTQLGSQGQYWLNYGSVSPNVAPHEGPGSGDGTLAMILPAAAGRPVTLIHAGHQPNGGEADPKSIFWSTWNGTEFVYQGEADTSSIVLDSSRTAHLVAQPVCMPLSGNSAGVLFAVGLIQYSDGRPPAFLAGMYYDKNHVPRWYPLTELSTDVAWCCGSFDGSRVLIGSQAGQVYAYDVKSGTMSGVSVGATGGAVYAIDFDSKGRAYALYNRPRPSSYGTLLVESEGALVDVSGGQIDQALLSALAVNRADDSAFVATDTDVFCWRVVSKVASTLPRPAGVTRQWYRISSGLPATPHPTNITIVKASDRRVVAYLATWGRSVWQTQLGWW